MRWVLKVVYVRHFRSTRDILFQMLQPLTEENFHVNYDTTDDLERKIHKHLCKKLGSPGRLLSLINHEDPAVNACIASFFKEQLLTKNSDATSRFFSSLDKVLSKWKNRNKVYPLDSAELS